MSLAVLGAMAIAIFYLHYDADRAVTVSFCTLAFAQLWHVFNMRDNIGQVFNNEITRNGWIWAAVVTCVALILGAIYTPLPSAVLGLTDPGANGWMVILPMSLIPLVFAPLVRLAAR
jgi:Ca2+-transporting ATPase